LNSIVINEQLQTYTITNNYNLTKNVCIMWTIFVSLMVSGGISELH